MKRLSCSLTALACLFLLPGCAKKVTDPQDPYESFNRNVFKFDHCIDMLVYRPVAKVYSAVTPTPVKKGVGNFFNNLHEPIVFISDFLQGKINYALIDMTRLVVNSTIGVAGLWDVAKNIGLPDHTNDFGKTMAYWSKYKKSAYLVLPFLGPSTIRDSLGELAEIGVYPVTYINDPYLRYGLRAIYYIDIRAQLLPMDKFMKQSFDPYAAVRNAYLQHRNADVAINDAQRDYHRGQPLEQQKPLNDYLQPQQSNAPTETPPSDDFSFGDDKPTSKN